MCPITASQQQQHCDQSKNTITEQVRPKYLLQRIANEGIAIQEQSPLQRRKVALQQSELDETFNNQMSMHEH